MQIYSQCIHSFTHRSTLMHAFTHTLLGTHLAYKYTHSHTQSLMHTQQVCPEFQALLLTGYMASHKLALLSGLGKILKNQNKELNCPMTHPTWEVKTGPQLDGLLLL